MQALEATRRLATREGWRYQHVQAIIVAIGQYAEAATGNRDISLNRPPGLKRGDVPQAEASFNFPSCITVIVCMTSWKTDAARAGED